MLCLKMHLYLFIFCCFLRNVDVTGTSSVTCEKADNSVASMQTGLFSLHGGKDARHTQRISRQFFR